MDQTFSDRIAIGGPVRVRTMIFESARISQLLDSMEKDGDDTLFPWLLSVGSSVALLISVFRSKWIAMRQ